MSEKTGALFYLNYYPRPVAIGFKQPHLSKLDAPSACFGPVWLLRRTWPGRQPAADAPDHQPTRKEVTQQPAHQTRIWPGYFACSLTASEIALVWCAPRARQGFGGFSRGGSKWQGHLTSNHLPPTRGIAMAPRGRVSAKRPWRRGGARITPKQTANHQRQITQITRILR